jgi:hypothetical protein
MTMMQPATSWFNQFTDAEPEDWAHDQWCWRHWAPCPVYGANGILASIMVMSELLEQAPEDLTDDGVGQYMHGRGVMCCSLGDEVMYQIWAQCPPSGLPEEAHG